MAENFSSSPRSNLQLGCIAHPHLGAVAQCSTCSKGLCPACAHRFEPPHCDACLVANNVRAERSLWFGLALTLVFSVLGTAFFRQQGHPLGISACDGLIVGFGYWGWKFLSAHLRGFPGGSFVAFGIYLIVKLIASLAIGLVAGPWQIFRAATRLRTLRHARALALAGPAGIEGGSQGQAA
jgi:hypothetical protein